MKLVPRDYQEAAHSATWNYYHAKPGSSFLVIEPTGTGKSLQIAMFIWHLMVAYPGARCMCVTHAKELIQGNFKELLGIWPAAPAGIYSSGLGVKDHRQPITFAGIMSVGNKAALFKHIDVLLVDEAHTISDNDAATYNKFIAGLRETNPHLTVIGYTATGFRMKGGMLTNGNLFSDVAFDLSSGEAFLWLIEQGYLSRPVPKDPGFELNSDDIALQAGDFNNKQTSQAMRDQDILERAVDLTIAMGVEQGRKAWLTFAQSIEDADLIADMFTYKGYPHESVHSKRNDRDEVLDAFRRGELQGVTNKDILTTGYNQKNIDLICALRLTRSPGLWVQMVGRGTRCLYAPGYDITTREGRWHAILASDKQNCLVLDFVGNTRRLGPINYPRIPGPRKKSSGSGEMVRCCPECNTFSHISCKTCEECGYQFPPPTRLQEDASTDQLVRDREPMQAPAPLEPPSPPQVVGVTRMMAMRHKGKNGKPDTMRVDYFAGFMRYSAWVGFEHPDKTFPRIKAEQWWRQHGGQGPAPLNIDDAVLQVPHMRKPHWIKVDVNGKFPSIIDFDFEGTKFELHPDIGGPPLQYPDNEPPPDESTPAYDDLSSAYYDDEIPF